MKQRIVPLLVAMLALCFAPLAFAQPAQPGGGGGPGGRFGGPGGMPGGPRDVLTEFVTSLGDANLAPDFTLTADQKQKIQAVRDDFKKQTEKWRTDHEADFKKIRDQMTELRGQMGQGGGGANREAFQQIAQARQDLMATAPKGDDAVKQIKAILSDDQNKAVEAKQAERQAEMERMRQEMMNAFGGPGAGGRGGAGGAGGGAGGGRGGRGGGGGGGNGGGGGQ